MDEETRKYMLSLAEKVSENAKQVGQLIDIVQKIIDTLAVKQK